MRSSRLSAQDRARAKLKLRERERARMGVSAKHGLVVLPARDPKPERANQPALPVVGTLVRKDVSADLKAAMAAWRRGR